MALEREDEGSQHTVEVLLDRIKALESRLNPQIISSDQRLIDINDVRVPYKFQPFPKVVYKRGHKKGQVDHPGNLTKVVASQRELESALAKGWSQEPFEHVWPEDQPAPAPAPQNPAARPGSALKPVKPKGGSDGA